MFCGHEIDSFAGNTATFALNSWKKKYNHASPGIDVLLSQQTDQITVEMITLK